MVFAHVPSSPGASAMEFELETTGPGVCWMASALVMAGPGAGAMEFKLVTIGPGASGIAIEPSLETILISPGLFMSGNEA